MLVFLVMLQVFCVMLHVFLVMLHVFRVMLQVFLVMLHAFCVMLHMFRVMLHVFPVMFQETRATLHETRATLQETPETLHAFASASAEYTKPSLACDSRPQFTPQSSATRPHSPTWLPYPNEIYTVSTKKEASSFFVITFICLF